MDLWKETVFGQVAAPLHRATAFRLRGKECRCAALEITHTIQLFSAPFRIVSCRSPVKFNAATLLKKFVVSIIHLFFD